ncbi:MAG: metal-dependent hydrolase [Haloarculaceae archaeon]
MNKRGHVLNAVVLTIGLGYVLEPSGGIETVRTVAAVALPVVLGALLPDVDTAFGRHRKTLHNLPLLAIVAAYPIYFGNLQYVWIGVVSHYVLDVLGSTRGLALLYPVLDREYNVPFGVPVDSEYADPVMYAVTGFELVVAAVIVWEIPQQALAAGMQALGL